MSRRALRQAAFWASILLILALGLLCSYSLRQMLQADSAAEHAQNVGYEVERLLSRLKDAEAGQRNYMITGDDTYLAPYETAPEAASTSLLRLFELTAGRLKQQERLMTLGPLVETYLDLLQEGIDTRRAGGLPAAIDGFRLIRGKLTMDRIRAVADEIVGEEQARYAARKERARQYARTAIIGLIVGFSLGTAALSLLFHWMNGEILRRGGAEAALASANDELRRLNTDLDARVQARTVALERANASLRTGADERSRMAETLRQANETLEALIDAAPFAIIALDPTWRVTTWNRAAQETFGYAANEIVGQTYPLVPDERRAEFDRLVSRITSGKRLKDIEVQRRRKDGRLLDIRLGGAPLRDATGRLRGAVYALEDITERKLLEQQLRRSQRLEAIGRLTGGLAHDFNNLLAVVIGNLDLLEEELSANARARDLAQTSLAAALRGASLTRQLLAFARRQPLTPQVFDLNRFAFETVMLLSRTLGEAVRIQTNLRQDAWLVEADPTQVEAALMNLAINARDAMPQGGRLVIETSNAQLDTDYAAENVDVVPGDYVMLAVSDTGTGIPPEILDRVCEPFFTTKEAGRGSGLGLSMIYGFVKQSGGHLKIYSEVGHGTTVRLYLPRAGNLPAADGRKAEPEPEQDAADAAAGPASATILAVEDDAEVRNVVVRQLGEFGYDVREAGDATAALEILKAEQPIDLLFTDMVLPGGKTGADLARAARQLQPDIRVLFTSGFAEMAARNGRLLDERMELLSKPYRKQDLARKIRDVLGRGK